MESRQKILLLDDDSNVLDLYKEILGRLPSRPDVQTALTGPRALALLDSTPFNMLICDLKMPKMDGLQVLSIVRKNHPELRTVVLTALSDEQFRSRVYALGVDLYWQKPNSQEEIKLFVDCLESLLDRDSQAGFRGMQSKSLVDIIQLECLSQNSAVLKITRGTVSGRIWIQDGEVIDAETENLGGEEAFRRMLAWRTGAFESLPAEPSRERTIIKSYNALLLETAQALDEAHHHTGIDTAVYSAGGSLLDALPMTEEMEFILAIKFDGQFDARGLENAGPTAAWARKTMDDFRALNEELHTGSVEEISGLGTFRHVALARRHEETVCVGWRQSLSAAAVSEAMKKLLSLWES